MCSQWNAVGMMRQRWASGENDPGRSPGPGGPAAESNGGGDLERVRREFVAREMVIDCSYAECRGVLVTDGREIIPRASWGAKVILRCSRHPDEHEFTLLMGPYTAEQQKELVAALREGTRMPCVLCGTPLELASEAAPGSSGGESEGQPTYACPWCGVRWVPPADEREADASRRGPLRRGGGRRDRTTGG